MVVGPLGANFSRSIRSRNWISSRKLLFAEELRQLLINGELLGRLGPAGAAELDRHGVADRFGQADQPVARRGIGDGQAAGRRWRTVATGGRPDGDARARRPAGGRPMAAATAGISQGVAAGSVPGLGAEIGLGRDKSPCCVAVHDGPRRVARLEKSSISGTIGSDVGRHGEGLDARVGAPALEGGRSPGGGLGVPLPHPRRAGVDRARSSPSRHPRATSRPASGSWSSRGSTTRKAIVSCRRAARRQDATGSSLMKSLMTTIMARRAVRRTPRQADAQPASWARSSAWPPAPAPTARDAARRRPAAARPRSDR